jgi:integrase/recombinase XerD
VRKIPLAPPDDWPAEAKELYWSFSAKLYQRLATARAVLLGLRHLFELQMELGLDWRAFPPGLLQAQPCKAKVYRRALRLWLKFLYARKELLLPLHEQLPEEARTHFRRRLLSHDQVLRFLELCPLDEPAGLRDRAIFEVAYATGMRRAELWGLNLGDLDLMLGTVHIGKAKNRHQRVVPLTAWARHFLERYLREARPQLACQPSTEALWLGDREGKRLHFNYLMRMRVQRQYQMRRKLGFEVSLHQLRHAVATHLLSSGAELRDVQQLLGHRKLDTTEIYTAITPIRLREVHQRCHPRNNGTMPEEV